MHRIRVVAITVLIGLLSAGVWHYRSSHSYGFANEAVDGSYEMPVQRWDGGFKARSEAAALQTSLQIQINATPEVDSTNGRCNLMVGNPAENENNIFITVTLDESKKIIYQSPILKSGERLAYVNLDTVPELGSWAATVEFTVLEPETGNVLGAVDAGVLIMVK